MQKPKDSEVILKQLTDMLGGSAVAQHAVDAAYVLGKFDGVSESIRRRAEALKEAA